MPGSPFSPDVLARFEECLAAHPDAPAVVADGVSRSYAELDRESAAYAAALREVAVPPDARDGHGGRVGRESMVAVVAERGPWYVAMVLGVLRAGAAFMPVEPTTPVPRARDMCRTARARVLLAQPGHEAYAAEVIAEPGPDWTPVVVPTSAAAEGATVATPERPRTGLAYAIFTSGSTGSPKGAMVTDGGLANHLEAKRVELALGTDDVIGLTAPLSFDISVWQTLTAVTAGGRVAVASPVNLSEPVELVEWVARHGVTVLELVPSFFSVLVDELADDEELRADLVTLRYLIATGEALSARLARRWYEIFPDIPLMNAYGPTECADDVTHHVITPEECVTRSWPSIGKEIQHTRLYVVGADGAEVGSAVEGELLVGGRGVGRGYIADPVRTALAFVPDFLSGEPGARLYRTGDRGSRGQDGTYDYHGRRDRQVKIRGHRVELGDVEAQLLALPEVATAASVLVGSRLRAFVTLRQGLAGDGAGERVLDLVRGSAPAYLVPHEVTVLDRLPTGRSGKIDYRALTERAGGTATPAPVPALPANGRPVPTLPEVRATVAEVLAAPAVRADDDFFALGGDSLLAMTLVSVARKRFGAEGASLRGFLTDPTPRGLLAVLRTARPASDAPELTPGTLSSGQERLWFLEQLHPGRDPLVIRVALTLHGTLDLPALRHALNAVVARHEPLRTVFSQTHGVPAGTIHPAVEISLEEVPASEADPAVATGLAAHTEKPPLMTARLARVAPDHHVLLLVMHHLVADGWSLAVLSDEIATYYRRHLDGDHTVARPAATYTHYVAEERRWLTGPEGAACEAYWADQLDGAEPVIDLPLSRPRQASPDFTAHHVVSELTEQETAAVAQVARATRATPFMAVTAAFYAVLRGLCGTGDLVVGIDSLNRSWPGSEGLIGTFVNQLPVRLTLPPSDEEPAFGTLLELVRGQCLGAYEHDRLPFHKIVAAVNPPRRAGRFPLFQVKVTQQSGWKTGVSLPGVEVVASELAEPVTDLDLMLDVSGESSRLRLELVYRPEVLDAATARDWLDAVAEVLRAGGAEPRAAVPVVVPAATGGAR